MKLRKALLVIVILAMLAMAMVIVGLSGCASQLGFEVCQINPPALPGCCEAFTSLGGCCKNCAQPRASCGPDCKCDQGIPCAGHSGIQSLALPNRLGAGYNVTVEGWVPSTSQFDGDKAFFHLRVEKHGAKPVLAFNFKDKNALEFGVGGVKMHGTIVDVGKCDQNGQFLVDACQECPDFEYAIEVKYESTNPHYPGLGKAFACLNNNVGRANGVSAVVVTEGPYRNYFNHGPVKGSIHIHNDDD
jgi:hypothetical protein